MIYRLIKSCYSQSSLLHSKKIVCNSPNPQEKPNLIIAHGFLGNGSLYQHLAQYSQTIKNFNSYLIDLPNHGKSYHTDQINIFEMGQALGRWIKQKNFKQNITLLGHSLGGRTIYALTKLHPQLQEKVKRIIILDAAPHSYLNYDFHLSTQKLLKSLLTVDLNTTKQQIQQQLEQKTPNKIWFQTLMNSVNFQKQKWDFNLIGLEKKYRDIIKFEIDSTDWKEKVIVIKALKSEFVNQQSIDLLNKIYSNLEIVDVNCGHFIQLQKPLDVIKVINRK